MSLENTPAARISALAAAQKTYFRSGATLSEAFRRTMLRRLDAALANWEKRLCDALWTDLHKSPEEAPLTEISIVRGEIRSLLRHLGRWMRPAPRPTPLKLLPAKSRIVSQPLGQALTAGAECPDRAYYGARQAIGSQRKHRYATLTQK